MFSVMTEIPKAKPPLFPVLTGDSYHREGLFHFDKTLRTPGNLSVIPSHILKSNKAEAMKEVSINLTFRIPLTRLGTPSF